MDRGNSRRRKHSADSVDGISDLPDSILGHILSFLPTKNAVATSLLSQRWRFQWTDITNLDFSCYVRDDGSLLSDISRAQFVEYVSHVLLLHKPGYLNRFSLIWSTGCIPFYVKAWITAAIARNVHQLFVRFQLSKLSIHVQRCMFSCESLQSLELYGNICISNEIVFSLPKLESLTLISISFSNEETLCKLLGGCPVLKYLRLEIDISPTLDTFRCIISSTSLRRLELLAEDAERRNNNNSICGVELDAPSLEYIKLEEISSISIRQSLVFLVEANVQLVEPDYEDQNHYNSVVEAFRAFDCARTLTLSPQVIWAFDLATVEMNNMFNKLTRLVVTKDWLYWSSLHKFIMLPDNLEVFIVNKEFDGHARYLVCDEVNLNPIEPNLVPRCLSNSLRKVSIGDYDGNKDEFAMVSYILKHGSLLQLMEIRLRVFNLKNKCELIQNIRKLPRKSAVCEVEFCHGEK